MKLRQSMNAGPYDHSVKLRQSMNAGPYDHYVKLRLSMNAGPYDHYVNSLFFVPVISAAEEIILSLRNKPGNINALSTYIFKIISRSVYHVLCHIINLSTHSGIFHNCLKPE